MPAGASAGMPLKPFFAEDGWVAVQEEGGELLYKAQEIDSLWSSVSGSALLHLWAVST